jgi:hypothetical protein
VLAAQPGGDGEFLGRVGAADLVEEGEALGGEQGGEGEYRVVHRVIVGQSVDGVPPVVVCWRCRRGIGAMT